MKIRLSGRLNASGGRPRRAFLFGGLVALTLAGMLSLGSLAPAEAQARSRAAAQVQQQEDRADEQRSGDQRRGRRRGGMRIDRGLLKNSPAMLKTLAQITGQGAASTVRFLIGDEPVALGTVVQADGFILTKASEIKDGFQVELPDGRRVGGKIVGVLKEHDLAAVKVEASGLTAAQFNAEAVESSRAGDWLLTPGVGEEGVLSAGNLSVQGLRKIPRSGSLLGVLLGEGQAGVPVYRVDPGSAAARAGLAEGDLILAVNGIRIGDRAGAMRDFGRALRAGPPDATYELVVSRAGNQVPIVVTLENGSLGVTLTKEAIGVPVNQVTENSGAAEAGIQVGDIILALDDRGVTSREMLIEMIQAYEPGATVDVTILQKGDEKTVTATLGYRSNRSFRGDLQNSLGSRLSGRAVDFPAVIQHDSVLNAEQMGGPILDLHGRVVGMNIARAGRVETYALPAQVIQAAIPALLSGKLPTATAPAQHEGGEPMEQRPLEEDGPGNASGD